MKTAWRVSKDLYYEVDANIDSFADSTITAIENGVETEYSLGSGGGIERKPLYTNPDTTVTQPADTLFRESDIEGYDYLCFIVTSTNGDYEVEEWCQIEPLKAHSGQFVISFPIDGGLYARKIYRSGGNVKPSAKVYNWGTTTEDSNYCIIKSVDAIKIV